MFTEGAGSFGHYQECSWQTLGQGQFKPIKGSNPVLGKQDRLEKVIEYKVEMICEETKLSSVIKALKSSHPYEVPAFTITRDLCTSQMMSNKT